MGEDAKTTGDSTIQDQFWTHRFWAVAGALTLVRIVVLIVSDANLGPDEAQYWYWSRDLAFGYFSKPPMIGWTIAASTSLFGNAEWAVRLPAPLLHLGAANFLFFAAKRLYDARVAFWAGLGWLTIPGVILSSFLITTDAPLLFFWSGALFVLVRIIDHDRAPAALFAMLGALIGLGLMSKYAMVYFPVALAMAMTVQPLRAKLLHPALFLTAIIALAIFAPNLIWNSQNDFQTLSHTAANANWGEDIFKPRNLLKFLAGQFVVFGIIPFAALAIAFVQFKSFRGKDKTAALLLLLLALMPLIIVGTQALISRAHANWAATAYPAAILLITFVLLHAKTAWLVKTSIALHAILFTAFSIGVANFALLNSLGLNGAAKDVRGWRDQTAAIVAQSEGYDAIVVDDRYLMGEMVYYQKDASIDIRAIDPNANIDNHYEAFAMFDPKQHKRILFVTTRNDDAHVSYRFRTINRIGVVGADLGPNTTRQFTLYELQGYFGPDL